VIVDYISRTFQSPGVIQSIPSVTITYINSSYIPGHGQLRDISESSRQAQSTLIRFRSLVEPDKV